MPSPEELKVIEGAAPKAAPTVTLQRGTESISVPESERTNYIAKGYDDPGANAPGPELNGVTDNVLARAEALDRGATFGLGGLAGSVGAGLVSEISGYDGPRAAAPGMGAPVQDKSDFRLGFEDAEQARRQRADALGTEGIAWEMGGGIAAALATGGSSALSMAPAALAERVGTKAAAKILGQTAAEQAGAGIAKTMGARALGGVVEGGLSGLGSTLTENVDVALENPTEAAQNILLGTTVGGGMGGVLGGGFGMVEGVARTIGRQLPEVERAIAPRPPVPEVRPVSVDEALQVNQLRPMTAAQVPDPERSFAKTLLDKQRALAGGEDEAITEGARSLTKAMDETELLEQEAKQRIGIAQKRLVNEAALQQGFADDLVDAVDPEDALRHSSMSDQMDAALRDRDAVSQQLSDVQARHAAALDAERQARAALDASDSVEGAPKLTPAERRNLKGALSDASKNAKQLTKELDAVTRAHGERSALADQLQLQAMDVPAPRRMTRIEAESRDMYRGLLDGIDTELKNVAGVEADNLMSLRKRVAQHEMATVEAFKVGDFGGAHNLMDQGLKDAIANVIDNTKSSQVEAFGKAIYGVPRSFLENAKVWGQDIAGRNALANPSWSNAIAASNDAGFKGMYTQVGVKNADGWGVRKGGNSAAANALLKQIGEQQVETSEVGIRRALRAKVEDFANRGKAWGDETAPEIAGRMARIQTHAEDILDGTALVRRDAASGRKTLQDGVSLATMAALGGAVTGMPAIGIPAVAGRWFLSSVGKYKGSIVENAVRGANKLVNGSVKAADNFGRKGNQAFGRGMGKVQREEALRESGSDREKALSQYKALTQLDSPQLKAMAEEAEKTNVISKGLGDAMLQHQIQVAEYVTAKLPKSPSSAVFSPGGRLSNSAATSLDRTLVAVNNPRKTFERIVDGAATAEDLDAVRTLFPEPFAVMKNAIMDEVTKNPRKVKSIRTQMYISRVTGEPLTPALMRIGKAQAEAQAATQGQEDGDKVTDGGDGMTAKAPINIEPDALMTRADRINAGG